MHFVTAVGLGVAFCALPGALTAVALRRGLERGFWPALVVQLGGLTGVGLWAVVAFVGVSLLTQNAIARLILTVTGFLLLLSLAWEALKDAVWPPSRPPGYNRVKDAEGAFAPLADFALGAGLSIANPGAFAFWLGVGSTVMSGVKSDSSQKELAIFFIAFMSGALLWCFFLAVVVGLGKKIVTPFFFRIINLVCGLALFLLALKLLWSAVFNQPAK